MAQGRVWKYGDDVNTDVIFPGRYLDRYDAEYLKEHALEDLDPEFSKNVKSGDVIVAGKNFGCGSSREQAATCLKHSGVQAVIGVSFARIFYRNVINQGIPAIESRGAVKALSNGDVVEIDLANGSIENITTGETIAIRPLPDFIMKIISSDGLIGYLKKSLEE